MPLSEMIWMQKHTPWQIYQIYCRSIQVYTQKKFSKCIKKYAEICIMYAEICIMYAEKCRSIQFLLIPAPIFLQRVLNLYVMPHIKSLCNATSCPCPPGSDCQFANCSFCSSGESIYDLPLWSLCPMCWCTIHLRCLFPMFSTWKIVLIHLRIGIWCFMSVRLYNLVAGHKTWFLSFRTCYRAWICNMQNKGQYAIYNLHWPLYNIHDISK